MGFFTLTNIAAALTTLVVARRLYWELTTGSRQRSFAKQHGCLAPKQQKWKDPFLGLDGVIKHLTALRAHRVLDLWSSWLRDNDAHTVSTNVSRAKILLTDDPENIKTVLATSFSDYSVGEERITLLAGTIGQGIFTSDGAEWKHSRDMLRPCFERSQVANTAMLDKHVMRLIDMLPADGSTVDLQVPFQRLAFDITSELLLGKSVDALATLEGEEREFVSAFDYIFDPLSEKNKNARWGVLALFLPDSEHKKCVKRLQDSVDAIISEQLSSQTTPTPTKPSFLASLLAQTASPLKVRSELLNVLLAGRDTTASVLTNLFHELPRHPAILARLTTEISTHIPDPSTPPTYTQLKHLKYLRATINETQRLYPILPSNSRQALKDTTLPHGGGTHGTSPVLVPKGTYVTFHIYSLHRRPDIYGPDAHQFVPERWLDAEDSPNGKLRPGWAFIPFNGGPRVCIGQDFALTQIMFVVVRLLQAFDVEARERWVPWRERLALTCVNLGGAKVGLRRRGG